LFPDAAATGIDHSPLVERYPSAPGLSACGAWSNLCTRSVAAGTGIFFHEAELRPGSAMALSFPAEVDTPILPHAVAAAAPFANLMAVFATFGVAGGSAEAEHVRDTLRWCEAPPRPAGERVAACATSLESTVRSATRMLGAAGGDGVWAAATSARLRAGLPRGRYVVGAVAPLHGDQLVACHRVPFPYAVYQCHMTTRKTDRAYVVSLRGRGGPVLDDVLAFCHRDTSGWSPDHPAFRILRVRLGTPVCHFVPYGNPVFGRKASTT
jgi:hypothetical protein